MTVYDNEVLQERAVVLSAKLQAAFQEMGVFLKDSLELATKLERERIAGLADKAGLHAFAASLRNGDDSGKVQARASGVGAQVNAEAPMIEGVDIRITGRPGDWLVSVISERATRWAEERLLVELRQGKRFYITATEADAAGLRVTVNGQDIHNWEKPTTWKDWMEGWPGPATPATVTFSWENAVKVSQDLRELTQAVRDVLLAYDELCQTVSDEPDGSPAVVTAARDLLVRVASYSKVPTSNESEWISYTSHTRRTNRD